MVWFFITRFDGGGWHSQLFRQLSNEAIGMPAVVAEHAAGAKGIAQAQHQFACQLAFILSICVRQSLAAI